MHLAIMAMVTTTRAFLNRNRCQLGKVNKSEMIKPGGANEPDCPTDPRKCSRTHP